MSFKFLGKKSPYKVLEKCTKCQIAMDTRKGTCYCKEKHFRGALKEAADFLRYGNGKSLTIMDRLSLEKWLRVSAGED